MDSIAASYSFLLTPVALLAIIALFTQRPKINALLLLIQSAIMTIYFWLNKDIYGSMSTVSLFLLTLCLIIWTGNLYLSRTTQV
ncbi:MAG TPA: hypothetical protein VEK06_02425, partial [Myxococcota bacterium]|nr:hypothetical protein [Myxococcota bacterium]